MREIKIRVWDNVDKLMYEPITFLNNWVNKEEQNHELMLYTGLKDKNGKEIYEGDILSFYDIHGVVKFGLHNEDIYNGWYVEVNITDTQCELNTSFSGAEIIGNIYRNPELIQIK